MTPTRRSTCGFTIVEFLISLGVIMLLAAVAMSASFESSRFFGFADTDYRVQLEATRGFRRLSQELRRSGWNNDGVEDFPAVSAAGDELRFRLLTDLDGNGEPYDDATGDLEWSTNVYSVRLDSKTRTMGVYDAMDAQLMVLARQVDQIAFATYLEDPTLQLRELRVTITTAMTAPGGEVITYSTDGSVLMRN